MRPGWALFVVGLCACTGGAPIPSTPAQRTPTPGTVTRDNPAGDAHSPVDAALTRLLEEPLGFKEDKFETLRPRLPDWSNWKRMRFFGYPTRAAFRYGKARYATVVLSYSNAEHDDAPATCIEAFVEDARRTAERFDVEVGPIEREMRSHKRGIEAIDFDELERRQARWEDERKAERAALRARLQRMRALARQRAQQAKAAAAEGKPPPPRPPGLRFFFRPMRHKPEPPPLVQMLAAAGEGDMPVVRTSGAMHTLADRDRYLVAIVAYRSWPGTCLVQSLALKVGTDEALARRVRERWIDEVAPALEWRSDLRVQPPIQNR